MSKTPVDHFNKEAAEKYDERNSKLSDITHCLHFLMGLALKDLPQNARVLCVGAGTGAEILSLSQLYPCWNFIALEPSASMIEVCRSRVTKAGLADRCDFVHGYIQDLPEEEKFDATLTVLVAHFINRPDRKDFFSNMTRRLKPGGYLVNVEISFNFDAPEFPEMMTNWEWVQKLMGATPESLANLPKLLREMLAILPPTETEQLLRESGIEVPVRFFQAFMIHGWHGIKKA